MTFLSITESTPIKVLKSVFDSFDDDSNGYLDKQEFSKLLIAIGIKDEAAQNAIKLLADENNDGLIDRNEFYKWIKEEKIQQIIKDSTKMCFLCGVAEIFQSFDVDGDNTITWPEFKEYMCTGEGHSEDFAAGFWHEIDTDRNGSISFKEFWNHTKQSQTELFDDGGGNKNTVQQEMQQKIKEKKQKKGKK